jgi:hypothetical protein
MSYTPECVIFFTFGETRMNLYGSVGASPSLRTAVATFMAAI